MPDGGTPQVKVVTCSEVGMGRTAYTEERERYPTGEKATCMLPGRWLIPVLPVQRRIVLVLALSSVQSCPRLTDWWG